MTSASGVRIGWADIPQDVRRAVEEIIGGTVVEAVSQAGGFSPGTADRVRTANGRRAFVKAVSPAQNERSAGDTLVHMDIRADNLLLRPDNGVTIVDWPWACIGPAWLDTLLLSINVRLYGGHDTDALLVGRSAVTGADPGDLVAVLTAFAGFFADAARQPSPAGLPTLRAFQRAQADVLLAWLCELLDGG